MPIEKRLVRRARSRIVMDVGPFDFGADFGAITLGRRVVDRWQTRYRIRALAIIC